uniref:ARAD1B22506p n=1 Tax=Blastobotrys adeninivorans TaxID=409370 RepID=A0A060TD82_BLAAD
MQSPVMSALTTAITRAGATSINSKMCEPVSPLESIIRAVEKYRHCQQEPGDTESERPLTRPKLSCPINTHVSEPDLVCKLFLRKTTIQELNWYIHRLSRDSEGGVNYETLLTAVLTYAEAKDYGASAALSFDDFLNTIFDRRYISSHTYLICSLLVFIGLNSDAQNILNSYV